jgi:hypothetical protein
MANVIEQAAQAIRARLAQLEDLIADQESSGRRGPARSAGHGRMLVCLPGAPTLRRPTGPSATPHNSLYVSRLDAAPFACSPAAPTASGAQL